MSKTVSILSIIFFALLLLVLPVKASNEWCHDELSYAQTIYGDDEDNFVLATDIPQKICGFGGDDSLTGGNGDDFIDGNLGADFISGGGGNDILHGGQGDDMVFGGDSHDLIVGGEGDDYLGGNAGDDEYLYGLGDGNDTIDDCDGLNTIAFTPAIEPILSIEDVDNDRLLYINDPVHTGVITLTDYLLSACEYYIVFRTGDVNGDGTANPGDWIYWAKSFFGDATPTTFVDVNEDGLWDSADLTCLTQILHSDATSCAANNSFSIQSDPSLLTVASYITPTSNVTLTIPITLNPTLPIDSAIFSIHYNASKLRFNTIDFNLDDSILTYVNSDDIGQIDLMFASEQTSITAEQIITLTFEVSDTIQVSDTISVNSTPLVSVGDKASFNFATTVPTQVTMREMRTENRYYPLVFIALSLMIVSWKIRSNKQGV